MDNPPKSFDMISSAMKLTGGFHLISNCRDIGVGNNHNSKLG